MKKLIIAIFLLLTTISYGQRSVGGSSTPINVSGGITLTDTGNGILSGAGGTGWVDYFRNMIVLCFDVAPVAGTTIEADYRYHTGVHQIGMWYKIN